MEVFENLRRPLSETGCADFLATDGVAEDEDDDPPALDWRGARDTDWGEARTEARCGAPVTVPLNCGLGVSPDVIIPNSFALEGD